MDLHEIWYSYGTKDAPSYVIKVTSIIRSYQCQSQGEMCLINDLEFDLENNDS